MAGNLSGDIVWSDLDPVRGSEQAGRRPVGVLSADTFNARSGTVVAIEVAGVKFPLQITMRAEGKTVVEVKVAKLEFLDKVDDKLFEKPKR